MAGFFGFFDYTKPGKGVSEEDLNKKGLALYFDILGRRFGKLISLNLLYFVFSIPALVINWFVSGYVTQLFLGTGNIIIYLYVTIFLLLFLGSGSASAAMNFVLRKLVNDTHAWVLSDFWEGFKSNFFQGIAAYIINMLVFILCVFAMWYYAVVVDGNLSVFLVSVVGMILVVFLMMQVYVYQIMASVKLKLKDIYKNAFLFAIGKLPISIVSTAVAVVVIYAYNLVVANEFSVIAVALIMFTLTSFTQIFITNNAINKYLLEPSMKAQDK